jgi:hypothetical protein
MHQPHFVGNARGIRAECVVFALDVHDALALFFILAHDVAEDAALAFVVPLVGGTEFVLNASRYEDGRGDLGMGVRPLVAGQSALIFENGDVLEPGIFLQIGDTRGPDPQNPLDLFVAELGHALVVMGCFHDDFVRAERAHLVVHAFSQAARLSFNTVERIGVRKDAHLPRTFGGPGQNRGLLLDDAIERARLCGVVQMLALSQDYPTLRDWISADFHAEFSAGGAPDATRG